MSDFEVLERLSESRERKFLAQDLAEAIYLSQSALSRLVDRLARHGLVERCGCEGDRRGIYVVLTEAGEHRHAEAVPTHRGVLAHAARRDADRGRYPAGVVFAWRSPG